MLAAWSSRGRRNIALPEFPRDPFHERERLFSVILRDADRVGGKVGKCDCFLVNQLSPYFSEVLASVKRV
jgi:hypothetical protein